MHFCPSDSRLRVRQGVLSETRGSLRTLATRRARRAPSACCRPPARPRLTRPPARHLGERPVRTQHADRTPLTPRPRPRVAHAAPTTLEASRNFFLLHLRAAAALLILLLLLPTSSITRYGAHTLAPGPTTTDRRHTRPTNRTAYEKNRELAPAPVAPKPRCRTTHTHKKIAFFWCVQSTYNFL